MRRPADVEYILSDCFLAVGQAVGPGKTLDFETVVWWHRRYGEGFHHAVAALGASWTADRRRMTAIGRYLGQRVVVAVGRQTNIDQATAERASAEVERGCDLNGYRQARSTAKIAGDSRAAFRSDVNKRTASTVTRRRTT